MKNMMSNIFVIGISLLLATSQAYAKNIKVSDVQKPSFVTTDIHWADFLARHDLVWNKSPMAWYNGPFMGNGMLGSVFFQEENHIRINVGRSDVEDHKKTGGAFIQASRLPIGHFTLKTKGKIVGFEGRLDLYNAEAKIRVKTDGGYVDIRALVHSDDMLIIYQFTASSSEADLEIQWHPEKAVSPARASP